MEAMKSPVMLMEIERELAGSGKEAALVRYDGVLLRLEERLEEAMRKGFPPDEFANAEVLKEAITLARKIVRLTVRVDGEARKA